MQQGSPFTSEAQSRMQAIQNYMNLSRLALEKIFAHKNPRMLVMVGLTHWYPANLLVDHIVETVFDKHGKNLISLIKTVSGIREEER